MKVELDPPAWQFVLNVLGRAPLNEVATIYFAIDAQLKNQERAAAQLRAVQGEQAKGA